jgi:single stranded DNA-binding protein
MNSVNKIFLIGHIGHLDTFDPQKTYFNASIAINSYKKDKTTNEKIQETMWVNVVFFNKLAEIARAYLKKGMLIHVEGKLNISNYTDKEGIKKQYSKVLADQMTILSKKDDVQNNQNVNRSEVTDVTQPQQTQQAQLQQTAAETDPFAEDEHVDSPF